MLLLTRILHRSSEIHCGVWPARQVQRTKSVQRIRIPYQMRPLSFYNNTLYYCQAGKIWFYTSHRTVGILHIAYCSNLIVQWCNVLDDRLFFSIILHIRENVVASLVRYQALHFSIQETYYNSWLKSKPSRGNSLVIFSGWKYFLKKYLVVRKLYRCHFYKVYYYYYRLF